MPADFGLVAHSAERHAHELAVRGARDALAERRLADARRPDETQDRALELFDALLHGKIFENTLFDLLETVVILFEHALGLGEILVNLRALPPRNLEQPVDVVTNDRRFRRHRRHELELVELRRRLLLPFLRHAGRFDAAFHVGELVRRVFHLAELFLNRLHLLIEVVLALALLHLLLDTAANTLLDAQHVDLGVDEPEHVLETRPRIDELENLLFLGELEHHVHRDGIGEPARGIDSGERCEDLGRNFLVELYVLLEPLDDRAREHFRLARVGRTALLERLGVGRKAISDLEVRELRTSRALDEHLDGAVGQLQELQDRRDRSDRIEILGRRLVDVGLRLSDEQDFLGRSHCPVESDDGFLAADEQGYDHVRIDDDVAQRQDRQALTAGRWGCICWHGRFFAQRRSSPTAAASSVS